MNPYEELLLACKALIDAPHYEHFAVRLNDEEIVALRRIKAAVAKAERHHPPLVSWGDTREKS